MSSNVTIKGCQAPEISFYNKLENGTRIELGNKYSYNVNYSPNNICRGTFTIEMTDKANPDRFGVKVTVVGIFEFKDGVSKEQLHVETFKEIFPYARALITTVTANAGVPPIIIPNIDIESQNIYKLEKNPQ